MRARKLISRIVLRRLLLVAAGCLGLSSAAWAQGRWITDTDAVTADVSTTPIALQFRREVTLRDKPQSFRIRVSA